MNISSLGRLLQYGNLPIVVVSCSRQLGLLHAANPIVGRPFDLILNKFASGLVADVQALKAMLHQFLVLRYMVCAGCAPFTVVTPVELILGSFINRCLGVRITCVSQQRHDGVIKLPLGRNGNEHVIGSYTDLTPVVKGEWILPRRRTFARRSETHVHDLGAFMVSRRLAHQRVQHVEMNGVGFGSSRFMIVRDGQQWVGALEPLLPLPSDRVGRTGLVPEVVEQRRPNPLIQS